MTVDWPTTSCPSCSLACRVSGVADTGTTCPRTARILLIRRTPSSKSPSSTAVMAAMSRLPIACPASPWPSPPDALVREPVLEHAVHHRLGVGERRDAVADVANGRDPELGSEHAGRAAVVGNGDDRGEVARVLLEPAQQCRQPGPAADRHDPRPARQEPLLVDDLHQRVAPVVRAERVHECPDDHHRADRHAGKADARNARRPSPGPAENSRSAGRSATG